MIRHSLSAISLLALASCASTNSPKHDHSEQVVYIAELKSFMFEDTENYRNIPNSNDVIISNSCGRITAQLQVLASTQQINNNQTVHREIGEWCTTPFDWFPIRDYLVVANYPSMDVVNTYPIDAQTAIVTQDLQKDENLTTDTKNLLQVETLENQFPYPYKVNLANPKNLDDYKQNEFLEVRDSEVFVVKGIELSKIFGEDWEQ